MISTKEPAFPVTVESPTAPSVEETRPGIACGFRWRVVDDPPPPPKLTRFQRIFNFLYEYNRY